MKKLLATLFALLVVESAVQAQVNLHHKAGVSINDMSIKGSNLFYPTTPCIRPSGGVGFEIMLSEVFSIQPELNLLQKGFAINAPTEKGQFRSREIYNQVEVPLLAKYTFINYNGKVSWFVHGGPYLGYYMFGSYKSQLGTNAPQEGYIYFKEKPTHYVGTNRYCSGNQVSQLDMGMQLGGGINIAAGAGFFVLDARYSFGLTNMHRGVTQDGVTIGRDYGKSRAMVMTIGYALPIVNTTFKPTPYTKDLYN